MAFEQRLTAFETAAISALVICMHSRVASLPWPTFYKAQRAFAGEHTILTYSLRCKFFCMMSGYIKSACHFQSTEPQKRNLLIIIPPEAKIRSADISCYRWSHHGIPRHALSKTSCNPTAGFLQQPPYWHGRRRFPWLLLPVLFWHIWGLL